MIDEELYKLASLELNSDKRRPDLWARAVALASDDHDEARYLYTNLRVEEMVQQRRNPSKIEMDADPTLEFETPTLSEVSELPDLLEDSSLTALNLPSSEPGTSGIGLDTTTATAAFEAIPDEAAEKPPSMAAVFDSDDTVAQFPSVDGTSDPLDEVAPIAEIGTVNETLDQLAESDQTLKMNELTQASLPAIGAGAVAAGIANQLDQTNRTGPSDLSQSINTSNLDDSDGIADETSNPQIDLDERANRDSTMPGGSEEQPHYDDVGKGRMYDILEHYDGRIKAVKQGVSWPALFFTLPWLLYRKLWGTALVYLILGAVLIFSLIVVGLAINDAGDSAQPLLKWIGIGFAVLTAIGMFYLPFRYGNQWVTNKLQRKGFEFETAVKATSPATALESVIN